MITSNITLQYNTQWRNTVLQELYLEVDATSQPITITLPEIASMGGFYNVKFYITDTNGNSATNNITIASQGSDLIDSGSLITISTNYGSVLVACNGSSWIALESSNIPPAIPPKVGLLAEGIVDMGDNSLQELITYYTNSIVTDVVALYIDGAVNFTQQGSLTDSNANIIAAINFYSGLEFGLKFPNNYIDKDVTYTDTTKSVRIEGIVQQSIRNTPFYFQSAGLDAGVTVQIYVYGYNLD